MLNSEELINKVKIYNKFLNPEKLNKAYDFAVKAHSNQKRASGDPYSVHPIEVANILTDLKLDSATITTGLLHDTIEDTYATYETIKGEFGGSVPNSLRTSNAESAWSRWRRGFELATADLATTAFEYPFQYQIPLPPGVQPTGDNLPFVAGVIKGYPTHNKELGIHWAATTLAGSLRFDNLTDQNGVPLSIESVYETDDFLTVKLAGTYDQSNPLPPPLFLD